MYKPAIWLLALVLAFWQLGLHSTVLAGLEDYYPSQHSWGPANAGSENISLFVFRDRNANGRYEPGEQPIANVAVNLIRPDGSRLVRRSNRYGFVNFVNSLTIPGVDIGVEGEYHFEVIAPPGWKVTSGNARQTAYFSARPLTRPGIVANQVPHPIGIVPILRISGRVVSRAQDGKFSPVSGALVSAFSSSGHSRQDLEWVNLIVTDNETYRGSGYVNNTVSGNHIGYNSSGYPVTVTHDEPFDFVGAFFGVAWPQAEGETLDVRAWRGEKLVGEEEFSLSAMGPSWFEADYRQITRIEFATRHFWQFVMDEPVFRFSER